MGQEREALAADTYVWGKSIENSKSYDEERWPKNACGLREPRAPVSDRPPPPRAGHSYIDNLGLWDGDMSD